MVLYKPQDAPVQTLFDLTGKVVAITGKYTSLERRTLSNKYTGGARGIGLAVATGYAEAGAQIAIIYRTTKTALATAERLASDYKTKARAYRADVTKPNEIFAAVDQIVKDFGKLDVIVANAGICSEHAGEDYTPEEFLEVMDVNVNGAFYTAQAAAKVFKQQGFGNVVFTASVSASLVNTPQRQASYNASKAGVLQLARSLAVEWIDFCRVNCVSPGYMETNMTEYASEEMRNKWLEQTPARRMASPYELKGAYLFCASDASSYMTGSNIVVDGGFTLP